ncbi:hypothetical protein FOA52_010883 [Chlamydomonas sp. UWO 241]|nr:hypothetical protein FOA52_010883 [Chlamydomonas sp. UWO 241]
MHVMRAMRLEFDRVCEDDARVCRDVFWESTGHYGLSTVRKVSVVDGAVLTQRRLKATSFGEGLTQLGGTLHVLQWRTGKGVMFGTPGLERLGSFTTELSDGWGLTNNGSHLIATDSHDTLFFIEAASGSFRTVRRLVVTDAGKPLTWLNELEFIDGQVWANVWGTECLAAIDLDSGAVTDWFLLHGLRQLGAKSARTQAVARAMDVLNGIAWDAAGRRLFVTGKNWPLMFEVKPRPFTAGEQPGWARVQELCHPAGGDLFDA